MKKVPVKCMILTIAAAITFTGCKGENTGSTETGTITEETEAVQSGQEKDEEESALQESGTATEEPALQEAGIATEEPTLQQPGTDTEKSSGLTASAPSENEEPEYIKLKNPGWEYYCSVEPEKKTDKLPSLELLLEEQNQITDQEDWFIKNQLTRPDFPYEDEAFYYSVSGGNQEYLLELSGLSGENPVSLDFSEFSCADDFKQEDYPFIIQEIVYAKAVDNILYVATGHNTYAKSSPHTAYITAIDLSDYHVIWKTQPLTCNSDSFEIIDNYIVCGYGFTEEEDFLHIVDTATGQIISKTPIKSKAEYIIMKDGKLFVRTYDTDYVFLWKLSLED